MHNLPFPPPTAQILPDEKSPTPLSNQERGISGGASQESEVPVKMCIPEAPEASAYFTGLVVLKHL